MRGDRVSLHSIGSPLSICTTAEHPPLEIITLTITQVDPKHGVGNKGLWQGIGEARFNLGKWDTALEAFNSVLFYESENEGAKAWLVRTLLGAERWQEAVNKAKEVVGQHQQNGELRQASDGQRTVDLNGLCQRLTELTLKYVQQLQYFLFD